VIDATWAAAAVVSALSAGILIVAAARSPSVHSRPAPEQI
jgi:hypothetical protein